MFKIKIIEVVGLPGSGKSYMIEHMQIEDGLCMNEEAFYSQCSKINKRVKIIKFLKTIFGNFKLMLFLILYSLIILKSFKLALSKTLEIVKYISLFDNVIERNNNRSLIIFDQGIIQYVWSICFSSINKMEESKLVKYIFSEIQRKYDLQVIYYKVDYKIAASRAKMRERKCFVDYLEQEEINNLYFNHCKDYMIFLKYLTKNNVFIIENKMELSEILLNIKGDQK